MCVCVCERGTRGGGRAEDRIGFLRVGVAGCCKSPDTDAGNETQGLCKSSS